MNSEHLTRLRRLRILQALDRAAPDPQGETALLIALRLDPELSPTVERVRAALADLAGYDLVEVIAAPGSEWRAGRITETGRTWLATPGQDGIYAVYHPSEKPEPAPKVGGRVSSVATLPPETKAWLDQELVRRQFTGYVELADLLAEQGYEISKSAVHRYGQKFQAEQKQLKQSIEMAKAFAEVVGDDGAALNQTLTALAQQELMAVIRDKRFADEDIDLPDLVKSIASLNRSDVNTRKFQIEQAARKKALEEAADRVESAAQTRGLNAEDARFWREQVLMGM